MKSTVMSVLFLFAALTVPIPLTAQITGDGTPNHIPIGRTVQHSRTRSSFKPAERWA
jgi:hypothetical protein